MESRTKRKVRSDKKISVKPLVSLELYECISRLSYIISQSIRIISEKICLEGLLNIQVIDNLYNTYGFRRDFSFSDYLVKIGNGKFGEKRTIPIPGDKKRLSMAFTQKDYERLFDLSHAMGKPPCTYNFFTYRVIGQTYNHSP